MGGLLPGSCTPKTLEQGPVPQGSYVLSRLRSRPHPGIVGKIPRFWQSIPLGGCGVAGAGLAIPGTVGIPGEAAVGTGGSIGLAAVQTEVCDAHS